MGKAKHNRNLFWSHGFYSESTMDGMRDSLQNKDSGYVKAPKTIHETHHFGDTVMPVGYTTKEMLDGLLAAVNSLNAGPDLYYKIGWCYFKLGIQDETRRWLSKAAKYNHPEAVRLLKSLDSPATRVSAPIVQRLPRVCDYRAVEIVIAEGVSVWVVMVDVRGDKVFRHAGEIMREHGVQIKGALVYPSRAQALSAAHNIVKTWGM